MLDSTVEITDEKVVVRTGDMETWFTPGDDRSAAAQIACLHTALERLRALNCLLESKATDFAT